MILTMQIQYSEHYNPGKGGHVHSTFLPGVYVQKKLGLNNLLELGLSNAIIELEYLNEKA